MDFATAAMGNKGYSTIPRTLFESTIFLTRVLPVRSGSTFIELLNLAAIQASLASMDANCLYCICVTTAAFDLLWRSSCNLDALGSLEKDKSSYSRKGSTRFAKDFRQCSCSGLVEPDMPKIPAACTRRNYSKNGG